ncbi:DNAJ heat shock N-terminal domain-containing protein [Senna tora]|uniref:DNAJ heat shock N-terminal domain-containing protein n=1 Tax=Senna tora TaxID=362788 RepID=A0A835CDI5_9FABA|nr:DNAJ heat shock N-terminal domain-containing protein [Senna tora]
MQRTVDALVKYPEDKSMEKAIMEDSKDKSIVEDSEDKLIVEDSEDMKIVEDSEDKEVVEDAMEFEVESTMDHEAFANEEIQKEILPISPFYVLHESCKP